MKRSLIFFVLIYMPLHLIPLNAHAYIKSTKVTLVVVDEKGSPLEGIDAGVAFEKNTGWGTEVTPQSILTNGDGKATFTGQSNGHIAYGAENDKYYPSYYDYDFKDLGAFGWKPWNPELKIVMRKVENPVPMYARNTGFPKNGILIPVVGEDVGFDLIKYDWVSPYGNGEKSDLIFNLESQSRGSRDYEYDLKITFTKGNGVIKIQEDLLRGSEFHLPRFAPDEGYVDSLHVFVRRTPDGPIERSENKNNHYIFRVRTVFNEGEIKSAMYGKILNDIWIHPLQSVQARIEFKYYLNPDGTKNLEFDPNRNLFKDLSPMERVGIK